MTGLISFPFHLFDRLPEIYHLPRPDPVSGDRPGDRARLQLPVSVTEARVIPGPDAGSGCQDPCHKDVFQGEGCLVLGGCVERLHRAPGHEVCRAREIRRVGLEDKPVVGDKYLACSVLGGLGSTDESS